MIKHLMMVPFTGLGRFNGFRGDSWLNGRIKIFEQFVLPSLLAQTNKNFVVWVCWRKEERDNPIVQAFVERLKGNALQFVHTYDGVPFWDDKYSDDEAYERLIMTLHHSLTQLNDVVGDTESVLMSLQPSDDCYNSHAVEEIQKVFETTDAQAFGYSKGYVAQYQTKSIAEYNPITNPPFFTIKFTRQQFLDPLTHLKHTGPYKSHEYISNFLKYYVTDKRGFLVGTHGFNISTVFDHPFKGSVVPNSVWGEFGLAKVEKLVLPSSIGNRIYNRLPYGVKRKLRYWAGDKRWILRPLFSVLYKRLIA